MLGQTKNLNKVKNIQIISSMLSNHMLWNKYQLLKNKYKFCIVCTFLSWVLEGASWTEKQVLFISLSGWEYDGREFLTYFGTNLNIQGKNCPA